MSIFTTFSPLTASLKVRFDASMWKNERTKERLSGSFFCLRSGLRELKKNDVIWTGTSRAPKGEKSADSIWPERVSGAASLGLSEKPINPARVRDCNPGRF